MAFLFFVMYQICLTKYFLLLGLKTNDLSTEFQRTNILFSFFFRLSSLDRFRLCEMSDKNSKDANKEKSINENICSFPTSVVSFNRHVGSHWNERSLNKTMPSFSTSVVSLHSYVSAHTHELKTSKIPEKKPSIIYFVVLFYTFLSMGFGTGLVGPSVLKFGEQIDVGLNRVVYILFARSFGFLAGTLIGGALIDHFSTLGKAFLTLATLLMCLTTLVIPFIYYLIPMIIIHLIWSISAGIVDNLAQILTIRYYQGFDVSPYIQALHGAFGVGAFVSPLVIAPFMTQSSSIDQWHYAYWIIGLLHVPNVICLLIYTIRDRFCVKKTEEIQLEDKEFIPENTIPEEEKGKEADNLSPGNMFILGLITTFLLLYVGTESGYGAYLHTYATLHLQFNKDIAAYINSLFWASMAFGRICAILQSVFFTPLQMISADLVGCIVSLVILMVWNTSKIVLWIGSILFGLSVASIYPSAIAYTERHVTITGKRMSALAVGGAAGDAIIPLLIGSSFNLKWIGSLGFVIICLSVVILASLLFAFIALYVKHQRKKENDNDK